MENCAILARVPSALRTEGFVLHFYFLALRLIYQ